jgi:hypothetical protein
MRSRAFYLLAAILIIPFALWLTGCTDFEGSVKENVPPEVEFVNVHADIDSVSLDNEGNPIPIDTLVFDYAPVIFWKGSDKDGFIEYYSYADITEAAAIENPLDYIPRIPQEAWVDTIATQATIFLLSEEDEVTEHVFYLRAFDDKGAESAVEYRRFFRSNNAPVIPRIGLTGVDESTFSSRYVVEDTLFTAPSFTTTYNGIQFSWRGSDPDDKALFTIPLEFQTILVKSPAETVFVSPWTDDVETSLINLETGYYTLNVWARDDGLTKSVAPARAEFFAIRPTFENNLLVVLESPFSFFAETSNPPSRENVRAYYEELLNDVAPQVETADLNMADGVDVRFHTVETEADAVSRSLISQYKMVIFIDDHLNFASQWLNYNLDRKQPVEEDYLRVGGRVWQMGRCLTNSLAYGSNFNGIVMYDEFFAIDSLAGPAEGYVDLTNSNPVPQNHADFIGTLEGIPEFKPLVFDTLKVWENGFINPIPPEFPNYKVGHYGLTGVDRVLRGFEAETTQQFISGTYGAQIEVINEDATVLGEGGAIDGDYPNAYPATATNVFLALDNNNASEVTRIVNWTFEQANKLNSVGQPVVVNNDLVFVSYNEGDQWSDSDSLQVDYKYNPISVMHLKPVEIRVEGTSGGNQINPFAQLRYRTAMTSFSYYFVERNGAEESWVEMLNWFFNPNLNQVQFDF